MSMKLEPGDTVYVKVTSPCKKHFDTDFEGKLGLNYHQQFGGGGSIREKNRWTVFHPKYGPISWYDTNELTLLKKGTKKELLRLLDRKY